MPYDLLLVDVSGIAHGTVALSSQLIQMLTQRIQALSQWIAQTLPLVSHVEILVGPRCMPLILPSNFVSQRKSRRHIRIVAAPLMSTSKSSVVMLCKTKSIPKSNDLLMR